MSEGNGSLRDGGCFKGGIVDVRFAYFPLLLLRGTVPFQLWWSSLLSVCLAEWFHMEEHISRASGAAERWDKQVWEQHTCVHSNKPLLYSSSGVSSEIYKCWVPGSCLDAWRRSISPKIIFVVLETFLYHQTDSEWLLNIYGKCSAGFKCTYYYFLRWRIFPVVRKCYFIDSPQTMKVNGPLENKHILTIIRLPLVCGALRHILNSLRKISLNESLSTVERDINSRLWLLLRRRIGGHYRKGHLQCRIHVSVM